MRRELRGEETHTGKRLHGEGIIRRGDDTEKGLY